MRLVIIRRQGRRKQGAGAVPHFLEKAGPLVIRVPVSGDRDRAPIGKAEGGDVDRIGLCMFAEIAAFPAPDPSAAVAAIGDNLVDRGAKMPEGRGVDDLLFPQDQADRHRTAGPGGGAVGDRLWLISGQRDPVVIAAIGTGLDRRQGGIAYRGLLEQGVAKRGVVGEPVDFAGGKRPDRRGHRQRRPRHPVIMRDPFIAAQHQRQRDDKKNCAVGDGQRSCSRRAGVVGCLFNRREREKFPSCAVCRDRAPTGLTRSRKAAKRLRPFSREGEGYEALSEGLGIVG